MPRRAAGITAAKVKSAAQGTYTDGSGLILLVQGSGSATWVLRYSLLGKRRDMGLGPARGTDAISLADVRDIASEARAQIRTGVDPIETRRAAREAKKAAEAEPPVVVTFATAADAYLAAHEPAWRNAKHRAQWRMTLKDYAGPAIGEMAIDKIATPDVLAVLKPLWLTTPETATRLRGRIENVLDFAAVNGWRDGVNPARWRGHLAKLLPARAKVRAVRHHAAIPWQQLPAFLADLRQHDSVSARAVEAVILTAARSGEVLGMRWQEVDLDAGVWVVPAGRMKAGREHRVALSAAAVDLLRGMMRLRTTRKADAFVFPGREAGRPLSVMAMTMVLRRMARGDLTVHGFRSTFRDWAGETTAHPREVVEAALAHRTGDMVEQAYARGDLFTKRRRLMEDWAAFCASAPAVVVSIGRTG
jgi:integrase